MLLISPSSPNADSTSPSLKAAMPPSVIDLSVARGLGQTYGVFVNSRLSPPSSATTPFQNQETETDPFLHCADAFFVSDLQAALLFSPGQQHLRVR